MKLLIDFFNSNFCSNFILIITFFIALITYKSDVKQKKLKNTLELVACFLEGDWISKEDKLNWNDFFTNKLVRNACGSFSLTGEYCLTYKIKSFPFAKEETIKEDIINIFSEGISEHYGRSVINILNLLEFIACRTNNKELDFSIIRMRLLHFYQLADYYNDILSNKNEIYYPEIKKLYLKLTKLFGQKEVYGEYYVFPIENLKQ